MKLTEVPSRYRIGVLMVVGLISAAVVDQAQTTPFSFILDEPSKTSAGVYAPDGTLIRTLWSKVNYSAGTNSAVWDGLDDNSNPVPAGNYQVKLLEHNTEYVWDGAIGNTSAELSGPTVHTGYYPMSTMAIAGTNAFYASGYNEGALDFRKFFTTDPQRLVTSWGPGGSPANDHDANWNCTATDGTWVYFASYFTYDDLGGAAPGCIVAYNVADCSSVDFTNGTIVMNGSNPPFHGIYVGTQAGLDGLAVQPTGNLLAAAVWADNTVYLFDKRTGSALSSISVTSPGGVSFSPDGSLWVISDSTVVCFTNLPASPAVALTILNFAYPLAVAVNPANANLILVADGGASQQVKAFDQTGTPLWTYGLAGGYQTNGVAVNTNKFWFDSGEAVGTFLCFAPDGSFWVGDGGNARSLHFAAGCTYLEQIMHQPHSYVACVDQNNPTRVFNQFLEFRVDYTKPLSQAWTLVNNWKVGVDPVHLPQDPGELGNQGIYEVTTFTNGRTYALINNYTYVGPPWNLFPYSELCELVTNQLRFTGIAPAYGGNARGWISLGPDGSARRTTIGVPTWFEDTLAGFDASNNPVWNPETALGTASAGAADPVPRGSSFGNIRATISSNNILVSFDQSLNNGWHLGGIRAGGSNWLWKASPAVAWMNGLGTYEISNGVQYAGNTLQAVDRNIIYGYHGEFFRGAGQAGQTMHFYDDGLFVGQFGECTIGHTAYEGAIPASAGNGQCPSLIKTAGSYYEWVNDESAHGPQRWHLVNAGNIREQTGYGTLGSPITLTNPVCGWPTAVTGTNGNQCAALSWQPVPGAAAYNVRYSLLNGGPYSSLAGTVTNTGFLASGLTNGQPYYFVVTAIQAGAEGAPSEQVRIKPFDTTQTVLCAGLMSEAGLDTPVIDVSSNALAAGQNSYLGAVHLTGLLTLQDLDDYGYGNLQNQTVGANGYVIFDDEGSATSLPDLLAPFTFAYGSGWVDSGGLERQYQVDGFLTENNGMLANPVGSLNLSVTDTNYHCLTVISPALFNTQTYLTNPRNFTMRLSSPTASAAFSVNEPLGYSRVFQFLFKGNVTLSADGTGGAGAIVQALFFDNAAVVYAPVLAPANPVTNAVLTGISLSGANLTLNGQYGQAGVTYSILMSTNLLQPLNQWTPMATNPGVSGKFSFTVTNATAPSSPQRFFVLKTQ